MRTELIKKYEKALEIAQSVDKLGCHINSIKDTLSKLETSHYEDGVLDEVWVDYFLEANEKVLQELNEVKDWYMTCMDNVAEAFRKGVFKFDSCYLEIYSSMHIALSQAHPADTNMVRLRLPNRMVTNYNLNVGLLNYDTLATLVYEDGILVAKNPDDPKPVSAVLDTYTRIIDFTYKKYEEKIDEIEYGFISGELVKWLIDRLYLNETTDEQLNEYWFAIDRYFQNLMMEKDSDGEWQWKKDVDIRWYMDCDSAWKEVVNSVARKRRESK